MQIDQQEPEYLNLAHQFLDDNFLGVATSDSFSKLPLISSNLKNRIVDIETPSAVDYFSAKLTTEQYYRCWRSISNNRFMKPFELSNMFNLRSVQSFCQVEDLMLIMPCTSSVRLENACWRAWYKNMNKLPELDPSRINWFKENDITVLYGPLIHGDDEQEVKQSSFEAPEPMMNDANCFSKSYGMPQALEALPISLAKRDSTLSDASLDYMMDESDDVFDRTSLVRTNSSQSKKIPYSKRL
ncbi:unnamed protein product [Ambrosiozyma monospora]|uniref:Unnamed protein product n=1 Tax=Ambrosiozyma monospora TaxID=43982 RepID=A0ACB5SVU5_AMBMO|nr:unnamed protein product [Ambrosiozyma monospora]